MTLKRAWLVLGIVTAITAVCAIVKNKLGAVLLGPEGIGIYAQAIVLITFGSTICSLGMAQGIVKHVAERRASAVDGISLADIISTSIIIQLTVSIFATAVLIAFRGSVGELLLGGFGKGEVIIVIALAIPVTVLFISFGNFLQGLGLVGRYSLGSILYVVAALAIFAVFVINDNLRGAVTSLLCSAAFGVLIMAFLLIRYFGLAWAARGTNFKVFSKPVAKILLTYGAVAFFASALETGNSVFLRSWIVNVLGPEQNGIYQAVLGLTGQYIGFFSLFNTAYLFPRMSSFDDIREVSIETNKALQLSMVFVTPLMAVLIMFRSQFILLLFTPAFIAASSVLVWQVLGDFVKITSWSVTASLLPRGKLRHYVLISIIYTLLNVVLSIGLLYKWQIEGVAIAYLLTYVLYLGIVISIQRKAVELRFFSRTLRLVVASGITLITVAVIPGLGVVAVAVKGLCFLGWSVLTLREMSEHIVRYIPTKWRIRQA